MHGLIFRSSRPAPGASFRSLPNAALLALVVAAFGCGGDDSTGPSETAVASVSVTPSTVSMHAGGTRMLVAVARSITGEMLDRPITWTTSSSAVATVTGAGQVIAVAQGTATITASAEGQTGTSTVTVTSVATVALTSVVSGGEHSCGLDAAGAAYCWGKAENRQLGETTGPETCSTVEGPVACSSVPLPVGGTVVFASLAAGANHTCGLTSDGTAWCWGKNLYGQLGNGTATQPGAVTPVSTTLKFVAIDGGADHTCALTSSGAAYCWGHNHLGQLGDGTTTDRLAPTPVTGGQSFKVISAGGSSTTAAVGNGHTCAVTTTGGTVYCWGDNAVGQLGLGSTDDDAHPTPAPVPGTQVYASVTAGLGDHSCALTDQGQAFCWGSNETGALGDGSLIDRRSPVLVNGGMLYTSLVAGGGHTCAFTTGGLAFCWGDNADGQLGDGTLTTKTGPSGVNGVNFTSIDTGFSHTCGRATTGIVYCWGLNNQGQVGNDGPPQNPSPSKVLGQS